MPHATLTEVDCLALVLAAGQGTRMKSATPKVLHKIAGRALLGHAVACAVEAGIQQAAIVVSGEDHPFGDALEGFAIGASFHKQVERLGTAHAVLAARRAIEGRKGHIVVLYGDTPLVTAQTVTRLRSTLTASRAAIAVLGFHARDPKGYGRLLTGAGSELLAIREEKDASEAERGISLCNSGIMAFEAETMLAILERIGNANAKGEYYLTDAIEIARQAGHRVIFELADEEELLGVNDRVQLAEAEAVMQKRLRRAAMDNGATLVAPETVFFCHDTRLGRDVTVQPHVVFGPGVTVEDGVIIKAFTHLEGAHIAARATIGPYARLRPGAKIGQYAHIGNFVEIKQSVVEDEAKINHLTYVGDARVGRGANLGAGTITCNYDGFAKHHTDIGAGAFIGSNSALVAPVAIGDGAYVGSGSVITSDVPDNALAVSRAPQALREEWAARWRARHHAAQNLHQNHPSPGAPLKPASAK